MKRAEELLHQHESKSLNQQKNSNTKEENKHEIGLQKNKGNLLFQSLMKEILEYPLMTQSPIDAMNQISSWQKLLKSSPALNHKKTLKTKTFNDSEQHSLTEILN